MDSLAALGLVSRLLSFIDFSTSLIRSAKVIRSSSREQLIDYEWLRAVIRAYGSAQIDLENALLFFDSTMPMDGELVDTIRKSIQAGEELQTWMEKIIPSEGKTTAGRQLKWPQWWLQRRLQRRDEFYILIPTQQTIINFSDGLVARSSLVHSIRQSTIFQNLDQESQSVAIALANELQVNQEGGKYKEQIIAIGRVLDDYGPQGPLQQTGEVFRHEASQVVLQKLQYKVMSHRAETIKLATTDSCKWIWDERPDNDQSSLTHWLVSGDGVYFIAGNEGSGKSTMMKYLFHQPQTFELLDKWAADDSALLATAAFFFWRNGTQLEKSEKGLLRSILYSVLHQQPRIIPSVLPSIYAKAYASISATVPTDSGNEVERWEIDMLRKAFIRLIGQTQSPIKLFFLIDGIDEYQSDQVDQIHETDQTDRRSMIEFLTQEIKKSKNAKAVIASRHLNDTDRFDTTPNLILHDSNRKAIRIHVEESLGKDLQGFSDRIPQISDQIASSANGNFLWASLTLTRMSKLLAKGHSFDDHDGVLDETLLPSTIHELYDHMWKAIPQSNRSRASEIVQIVMTGLSEGSSPADEEIRLVDLMFALGHPDEAIKSKVFEWQERTIQQKCKLTAYPFMLIWPGFLTVGKDDFGLAAKPNARVQYCHRSVPEYFQRDESKRNLKTALGDRSFCPHLAHLRGAVQHLKTLPRGEVQAPHSALLLWNLVTRALLSAKRVESEPELELQHMDACQKLLQQLDLTMSHHRDKLQEQVSILQKVTLKDPYDFFRVKDFGRENKYLNSLSWVNFHPDHSHPRRDEDSFLALCIRFGLKGPLEDPRYLKKGTLRPKNGRPLLDYALYPAPIGPYDLISPEVVQRLLECGAKPNEDVEIFSWDGKRTRVTCWEHALMWQHQTYKVNGARQISTTTIQARRIAEIRLKIMDLLIEKGAKKRTEVVISTGERLAAKDVLRESFTGWVAEENLERVLGLFDAGSARQGVRGVLRR